MLERLFPAAVRYRARRDLRAHLGSLVLFALLIGGSAGALIACVAAAGRTDTAFARLRASTRPADVYLALQCAPDSCGDPAAEIEALSGVGDAIELRTLGGRFETSDGRVVQDGEGNIDDISVIASPDPRWGDTVDRLLVVEGRLAAAESLTEAVVTKELASSRDLSVGDRLLITTGFSGEDEPRAHDLELDLVGVVLHPFGVRPTGAAPFLSAVIASRTFAASLPRADEGVPIAVAFDDVAAGRDALAATPFGPQTFLDLDTQSQLIRDGTDNDRFALLAIGGIGAIAAFAVLAPLLLAAERRALQDGSRLRALGFTRRDLVQRVSLHGVVLGVCAAVVALGVAAVGSRWAPIAEARQFEPDPGFDLDGRVLGIGAVAVALATLATATIAGWNATSVTRRDGRGAWIARVASTTRLRPSAGLGLRIAFGRPPGGGGVGSLVAIATGAAGIVAALTFTAGLDHLQATPRLVGAAYDLYLFHDAGDDPAWGERQVDALLAAPEVAGASAGTLYPIAAITVGGVPSSWLITYDPGPQPALPSVVTAGRAPLADDEILVHGRLRRDLGEIGDVVTVALGEGPPGSEGDATLRSMPFTIVGEGVTPVFSDFGRSALITLDGLRRLAGPDAADSIQPYVVTASFRPGTTRDDVIADLVATGVVDAGDVGERPANLARDQVGLDLDGVDRAPKALSVLLALLGSGVLALAIAERVRSWRSRIAVHRTLGMSGRQSGLAIVLASVTLLIAAAVLALPVGVAAGRSLWLRHAANLGVIGEAPVRWWQLGGLFAFAVAVAVVAAVPHAWRRARERLAPILRVE